MNSAKTLLVVAVLGALGLGVYLVFNKPEPPDEPISGWDQPPETEFGHINDRTSSRTDDFNPNATPGGAAQPWNPSGGLTGSDSRELAPFDPGSRSFTQPGDRTGSSERGTGNPATSPQARFPSDTIPNSDVSAGRFGSQTGVTVPTQRAGFDRPPFGTGATDGAIGADALGLAATTYGSAMTKATVLIGQNQFAKALAMLTRFYDDPSLSATDHVELNKRLDQLAGTVIYSREHDMVGRPHVVRPNERLEAIARSYNVPWQLLAKINGIDDPDRLQPGQQLKVLQGPFKAIISKDKQQLTLMIQGHYAGRFSIQLYGTVREGRTHVRTKNSTGRRFLVLDNNVQICSPIPVAGQLDAAVLSQQDIEDVFDILQVQSDVLIRR